MEKQLKMNAILKTTDKLKKKAKPQRIWQLIHIRTKEKVIHGLYSLCVYKMNEMCLSKTDYKIIPFNN